MTVPKIPTTLPVNETTPPTVFGCPYEIKTPAIVIPRLKNNKV